MEVYRITIDRVNPGTTVTNNTVANASYSTLISGIPAIDHASLIVTPANWAQLMFAMAFMKAASSGVDVSSVETAIALL